MTQGRNLSIARLIYILTAFTNVFTHMCLYCVVGEFLVIQVSTILKYYFNYYFFTINMHIKCY